MAGCLHVFCSSLAAKKSPVSRMNQPCLLTYVFQVVVKCTLQTITAHTTTHCARIVEHCVHSMVRASGLPCEKLSTRARAQASHVWACCECDKPERGKAEGKRGRGARARAARACRVYVRAIE